MKTLKQVLDGQDSVTPFSEAKILNKVTEKVFGVHTKQALEIAKAMAKFTGLNVEIAKPETSRKVLQIDFILHTSTKIPLGFFRARTVLIKSGTLTIGDDFVAFGIDSSIRQRIKSATNS